MVSVKRQIRVYCIKSPKVRWRNGERDFELKKEYARQLHGRDGEETIGDDVETGANTVAQT